MKREHHVQILGVLVILWGALIYQAVQETEEPRRVPLLNRSGPAKVSAISSGNQDAKLILNLEVTAEKVNPRPPAFEAPKNIFSLYRTDNPGGISQEPVIEDQEHGLGEDLMDDEYQQNGISEYKFLGYIQLGSSIPADEGVALLSTPGMVHSVRAGETMDGRIFIKDVTPQEVTVEDMSSHQEQRLKLQPGP